MRQQGSDCKEAIEIGTATIELLEELEELGGPNFYDYYDLQMSLSRLHAQARNHDEAIRAGKKALKLQEQWQITEDREFQIVALLVTRALNVQGKHEQALRIAREGKVNIDHAKEKDLGEFFELFRECGRAYMATNRFKEAKQEWEMLIYHAENREAFSLEKQLEYLHEYSAILKRVGDLERLAEIAETIKRMQQKINGKDEPVVQESRYSN